MANDSDDAQDGEREMSAECRVEALPMAAGDISIDGLRLRLDIRIVPRNRADAASGDTDAMFRVVSAKLAASAGVPAYQWAAVMVGMGVLIMSLVVWFAGGSRVTREEAPVRATAERSYTPQPLGSPGPVITTPTPEVALTAPARPDAPSTVSAADARLETTVTAPPAAAPENPNGSPRVVSPAATQPRARPDTKKASAPPTPSATAAAAVPPAARPAATAAVPPSVGTFSPQAVAQRPSARSDMLDLFGDPK